MFDFGNLLGSIGGESSEGKENILKKVSEISGVLPMLILELKIKHKFKEGEQAMFWVGEKTYKDEKTGKVGEPTLAFMVFKSRLSSEGYLCTEIVEEFSIDMLHKLLNP